MTFHYHFSEDKIRFLVVNLALFTILYKWYCRLFSPEDKKGSSDISSDKVNKKNKRKLPKFLYI